MLDSCRAIQFLAGDDAAGPLDHGASAGNVTLDASLSDQRSGASDTRNGTGREYVNLPENMACLTQRACNVQLPHGAGPAYLPAHFICDANAKCAFRVKRDHASGPS